MLDFEFWISIWYLVPFLKQALLKKHTVVYIFLYPQIEKKKRGRKKKDITASISRNMHKKPQASGIDPCTYFPSITILLFPNGISSTIQPREMWWEEYKCFFPYKAGEVESLEQVVFRNKSPCEMAASVSWFEDVCSCPEMGKIPFSSEEGSLYLSWTGNYINDKWVPSWR